MEPPKTSYSALPHLRPGASEAEVLQGLHVPSAAKSQRCPLGFKNDMMVAGRLRSDPTQIVYVEWRCRRGTRGQAYFYVDADKSTEPVELSDILENTVPAEIVLRCPITVSGDMFEEGAARLWDTHVDICANEWARVFEEANVDECNAKDVKEIKKKRGELSDAKVEKYLARYDKTKRILNVRDLALAMRALHQRYPDGPKPYEKILLKCRKMAITTGVHKPSDLYHFFQNRKSFRSISKAQRAGDKKYGKIWWRIYTRPWVSSAYERNSTRRKSNRARKERR